MEFLRSLLQLRTIIVNCPQLDNLEHLAYFVLYEIGIALKSSLIIMLAWMSLYFTNFYPICAFLVTAAVLTYISRRWYKCGDHVPNEFLLKLRLAKMLYSCICTLFCLFMFLLVSLKTFQPQIDNDQALKVWAVFSSRYFNLYIQMNFNPFYNWEIPILIYLFALESVLLTDIVSNVVRMTRVNRDYWIALGFEGPIIFQCTVKIVFGVWAFNIANEHFGSKTAEIILLVLSFAWNGAALIDIGLFRKKNPTPRRNDFFGYKMIHDITWFQVDVDIVAYSISILLYSQWKSAPNLVYPEEISLEKVMIPRKFSLEKLSFELWNQNASHYKTSTDFDSELVSGSILVFTSEALFLLFMFMISLRFKINFMDSYKYTHILRHSIWMPQFIPAEQRHPRHNPYRRELPFQWPEMADNLEAAFA